AVPEPKKPEKTEPEGVKTEPKKTETAVPELKKPEKTEPEGVKTEPQKTETAVPDPKKPENPKPSSEKNDNPRTAPAGKIRFTFRYAPWKDVIEWFADQAALSLQADNVPTGTLNLTDGQYYTPTEALDILNGYLLFKEYTLLRKGKTLFVIYLPDGIPPNLLEPITPAELDTRGKYEICRCVFSLSRTTPEIVQAEITNLLGPQASVALLPKSQQIAITETGGTLLTIRNIIKRIDDPDDIVSGSIHIVEMTNMTAEEALGIMRKLLAITETDISLRTAADVSGKKIFLSGRPDMIERSKEILARIDSSYGNKEEGQPQFEVYNVGTADPITVLAILQTLLAGTKDVRLSLDAKTGGIAALGRPSNHATIREAVKQMQLNVPQIDVIPLKRISPLSAVESIKKFFATASAPTAAAAPAAGPPGSVRTAMVSTPPPTVEADVSERQIIVRGTVSQITEIRALLAKLGEDGSLAPTNNSTVRAIPLSPAATAIVLEQLQSMLPKLDANVKVVAPKIDNDNPFAEPPKPETNIPETKRGVDKLIEETFESNPPII
ncbi:MAG: hypothetical protein LBH00_02145, partial [Planctomycetaceae bacterium]|nr:hypothetical protein [Planctomycetaceae bacterium]